MKYRFEHACNQLRERARELSGLADAFETTGNDFMRGKLSGISAIIQLGVNDIEEEYRKQNHEYSKPLKSIKSKE